MNTAETTRQDMMELSLNKIIRKNLTISSLSMILGEMMSELVNDADLISYTGNFEQINTLLDCILDESKVLIIEKNYGQYKKYVIITLKIRYGFLKQAEKI